ncbi:epididymal protein 13 isoform X2 [Zalophus californianus]|uniref:Epididymal protein 13 isoform X2 n=1 Tax=Zalophus californianus TaxID=9704 RepID=A0A6P9F5Y1_ZALCA|nr:epididymal protein 13 isoform X2 [Zalophus californianus]
MRRCKLCLRMPLLILLFLGLAEACIPREVAIEEKIKLLKGILGMMTRLSTDGFRHSDSASEMPSLAPRQDRTEEEMKKILGLLSLQVLNEETSGCKEEVLPEKLSLATTAPKKSPAKRTRWNMLKCAYMMVTFLFVSYNKGDWDRPLLFFLATLLRLSSAVASPSSALKSRLLRSLPAPDDQSGA